MISIQERIEQLKVHDISYILPDRYIARYPIQIRHDSKLLVYKNGLISDLQFFNLPEVLPEKSMLVFNNTKVIHARIIFEKPSGAFIEVFCLEPYESSDYESAFAKKGSCKWKCIIGNQKKWKEDTLRKKIWIAGNEGILTARKEGFVDEAVIIQFEWSEANATFSEILENAGYIPIPPYLKRDSEKLDNIRYQTIYADIAGSVAAPTAGLHFTNEVLRSLDAKGFKRNEITLHVGAGTFRPFTSGSVLEHKMHSEYFSIDRNTINSIVNHPGPLIAIGTTSVRTLESLYLCGKKLFNKEHNTDQAFHIDQWEWLNNQESPSASESLNAILQYLDFTNKGIFEAKTQLMIVPGFEFKLTKGMVTNFHQPQSTLLSLVAAFIGDDWKRVYNHALNQDYRFLSYGDSSLLLRY